MTTPHVNALDTPGLPSPRGIREAIRIYLEHAYAGEPPESARSLIPPPAADPVQWLLTDPVERGPRDAGTDTVRSFALRLGNSGYPHMKLRIARPPVDPVYLFSVDSHDAMMVVPRESKEYQALEDLKRRNAAIAAAIHSAWQQAGLPTEQSYLRQKLSQARSQSSPGSQPDPLHS